MTDGWRRLLMALALLLTAADGCNGNGNGLTSVHAVSTFRALLQRASLEGTARGVASAVLYSDRRLVVNGTYQGFPGAVSEVRLTTEAAGLSWCRIDHVSTVPTQGTFSDTCSLTEEQVNLLDGSGAWVYVYDTQRNDVLGGRLNFVARFP